MSEHSFPLTSYQNAGSFFDDYHVEVTRALYSVDTRAVTEAGEILLAAYTSGSRVFACGNGGSASIANHLACDHVKNIRKKTKLRPDVTSFSSNTELLTAIANDMSYEDVFTYQLQCLAEPGDVLVAISSSGESENIIRALRDAKSGHITTIALTGFSGGWARQMADVSIHVDCANYGIIEDVHQSVMHSLAQYIRHTQMSEHDIPGAVF